MKGKASIHPADRNNAANVTSNISLQDAQENSGEISNTRELGLHVTLEERWRETNAQAIEAYNAYVDRCGLPLGQFRYV